MRVILYPDGSEELTGSGPVRRCLKDLLKQRPPKLWTLVAALLKNVRDAPSLDGFRDQGWVERLSHVEEPIFSFRIPPGKLKGGVVRIYFGYDENAQDTIVLLAAEHKTTTHDDPGIIRQAVMRYRETCKRTERRNP
jgi:hypothetical protein